MSEAVTPIPYAAVLADLIRRRDELSAAIKAIEGVMGTSTPTSILTDGAPAEDQHLPEVPAGQYRGMSISEASKKLLKGRRKSMNSAEIAQALIAGGMAFNTADPGNTIGSVLTRRFTSVGDIVRVSRGQWGLREWYPHANFKKKSDSPKDTSAPKLDEAEMPIEPEQHETIG